jgi:hypothetical protein
MSHPHPLTWLYKKLGRHYPAFFITVELQTAFLIATGAVALFSFYYSVSSGDFIKCLAITLGLTAIALAIVIARVLKRLRPLRAWIGGARSSEQTAEAWHLAVSMPMELIRRDFLAPILVTVAAVIGSMIVLDLSWLAFFPITFAALLTVAYAATLHYLALELAIRPILFDINAALDVPVRTQAARVPAADQRDHRSGGGRSHVGRRRDQRARDQRADRALRLLHGELRADRAAHSLDPPARRGSGGRDGADSPGPLRRARSGHDLR